MTTPQIFLWTNYDHTPKNSVQRRPGPTGGCGLGSQSDLSVGPLSLQRQYHCSSVYLCIFVSLFFFVSEVLVSFFPLKNIQVLTKSNTKISLSLPSTVSQSRNFEEICSKRSDNFQTHCILPLKGLEGQINCQHVSLFSNFSSMESLSAADSRRRLSDVPRSGGFFSPR